MTLLGKTWTVDTLRAELADLEKKKDARVMEETQRARERRNNACTGIRAEYRARRNKLLVALNVLLAEEVTEETPED